MNDRKASIYIDMRNKKGSHMGHTEKRIWNLICYANKPMFFCTLMFTLLFTLSEPSIICVGDVGNTWVCFPSKFNSFHLDSVCTLNLKHFAIWQQLLMMTVRFQKVSFLFVLPDFRQGFDRRTPSHHHLHVRLLHRRHSRSRHPNCCR